MKKTILALDPKGSYGYQVATLVSSSIGGAEIVFCKTNADILKRFAKGEGDFAVAPKSNIKGGRVDMVMDWWLSQIDSESSISIQSAFDVVVRHCLATRGNVGALTSISEVLSHEQALFQCSRFLNEKGIQRRQSVSSTAESARLISLEPENSSKASICSRFAAEIYGLDVLAEGIADAGGNNITTFHLLCREKGFSSEGGAGVKTEMLFGLNDTPGALFADLAPVFGRTNIRDIQSMWWKRSGEEVERLTFHLVFEGRNETLLKNLSERVLWLKVMGTFPTSLVAL